MTTPAGPGVTMLGAGPLISPPLAATIRGGAGHALAEVHVSAPERGGPP